MRMADPSDVPNDSVAALDDTDADVVCVVSMKDSSVWIPAGEYGRVSARLRVLEAALARIAAEIAALSK